MYVLLYLEFYAPTFTSAEILRAAELSPSCSVGAGCYSPGVPGLCPARVRTHDVGVDVRKPKTAVFVSRHEQKGGGNLSRGR